MAKWIASIFGISLIVTNGFWLYRSIDSGVTRSYEHQEEYERSRRVDALQKICSRLVSGMPKDEAVQLLQSISQGIEPYEKHGAINTTWLSFKLNDQGVVAEQRACLTSPFDQIHTKS